MTEKKSSQLVNLLQQEVDWIDLLINLLSEEKTILATRQFDALEVLANQKQALSDKLEESAKNRMSLLEPKLATKQPKRALQEFLLNCTGEEAHKINELNNQLAQKLLTCRELNAINGQVITTNINTREEIINALTGQNTQTSGTYTASGAIQSPADKGRHQEA